MYAESLIFLRFGCYVHNPDAIYTKGSKPIMEWLDSIHQQDSEWGYTTISSKITSQSVICIGVPTTLNHVLCDFDADYTYTDLNAAAARSILSARKNTIRLTRSNVRTFLKITNTTPSYFVTVMESYLSRLESNPTQPVYPEEIDAIKSLGVDPRMVARLPRADEGGFGQIFIDDEHHRLKCL